MHVSSREEAVFHFVDAVLDRAADDIAAADEIILCREGGFGHQLIGPDMLRRRHAGRRCLFLLIEWTQRHNPFVPLLQDGVRVIHIPAIPHAHAEHWLEFAVAGPAWSSKLARYIQERLDTHFGKMAIDYEGFLHYIASSRAILHYSMRDGSRTPNTQIAYLDLCRRAEAPRRRLPESLRSHLLHYLRTLWAIEGADAPRIATTYLRQKGGAEDSIARSGATPQAYLPTFAFLAQAGYKVFVIGDVLFAHDTAVCVATAAERIVEAGGFETLWALMAQADPLNFTVSWSHHAGNRAYVVHKLLDLFLMTECAIFIGEAGGALQLAPFDGIPSIAVNAFPYGMALPNTAHLYKIVHNQAGELLPYQLLLSRYLWSYTFPGFILRPNTDYEILDAVATAINSLVHHPAGVGAPQIQGASEDMWLRYCNGVISPAFFRIYERGSVMGVA